MAECFDKNMIDKDEYPQTAELEQPLREHARRPVERARQAGRRLLDDRLERGLHARRRWRSSAAGSTRAGRPGKPTDKPNLVIGINAQICWDKFATSSRSSRASCRWTASASTSACREAVALCDENTIGVVAILGSTFDGAYEPVEELSDALDELQESTGARHQDPRRRRVRAR